MVKTNKHPSGSTKVVYDSSYKLKVFSTCVIGMFGVVLFVGPSLNSVEGNPAVGFLRSNRNLAEEALVKDTHFKSDRYRSTLEVHEEADRYRKIDENFTEEPDKTNLLSKEIARKRELAKPTNQGTASKVFESVDNGEVTQDIHMKTNRGRRNLDMHDKADRYRWADGGIPEKLVDSSLISEKLARMRGLATSLISNIGRNKVGSDDYSAFTTGIHTKVSLNRQTLDKHEKPDRYHGKGKDYIQHTFNKVPIDERVARKRGLMSDAVVQFANSDDYGEITQDSHSEKDRYRLTLDMHDKDSRYDELAYVPDQAIAQASEISMKVDQNHAFDIHTKTDRNRSIPDMHDKADRFPASNKVLSKETRDIIPVSQEMTRKN